MKNDIFETLFYSDFMEQFIKYEEDEDLSALSSKQLELDEKLQTMSQETQDFFAEYISTQNSINRRLNCTYFKTGIRLIIELLKK